MTYPKLDNKRKNEVLCTSYTTFLLRCWQEQMDGEPAWRFTLVQLGDEGSKQGFASLEDVTEYMCGLLAAHARPPNRTNIRDQN